MPKTIHPEQREDRPYRTGPNVDIGLEPGAVTVDPETAAGVGAAAARDANKAKTEMTDDGYEVVHPKETSRVGDDPLVSAPGTSGSGMADPSAPAVDEKSKAAKKKDPTTIANEPSDIKGDPKADIE